jgi:hypothetical protein
MLQHDLVALCIGEPFPCPLSNSFGSCGLHSSAALSDLRPRVLQDCKPSRRAFVQVAASSSGSLAGEAIDVLGKLARWPAADLFPVLDIFRLLVLNAGHARLLSMDAGELEVCNAGFGGALARGLGKDAPPASLLVAHRLACNCCAQAPLRRWLFARTDALFDLLAEANAAGSKNGRAALATLLLNYGVAIHRGEAEDLADGRIRGLSMLCEVRSQASDVRGVCL